MINTSALVAALMPPARLVGGIGVNVNPSDIVDDGGGGGGDPKAKKAPRPAPAPTVDGGFSPKVDVDSIVTGPNYTPTKDPNVVIGKNGFVITRAQYDQNQKSDMPFTSFEHYADWIGGWAHPVKPVPHISPYYRTYPAGKISGGDILQLYRKNDPQINAILDRQVQNPGDVPLYGPEDSDTIRALIAKNNSAQ